MKTEELRIGNYVNGLAGFEDNSDMWELCKVVALDTVDLTDHEIWVESKGNTETFIDFKGIPLTREHILRYSDAWEESIDSKEICVCDRFIFIWKESYKYWYVITKEHNEYLTKIEFVHEYQNFIFVMTGEELTIK